jgi:carbonic anhydrase
MSHAAAPGITADEALQQLGAGNQRYAAANSAHPRQGHDRRAEVVANGQKPIVTLVSCSDSRVPVELIFDAGIGDLFVIRVAGNVCANDEIGSAEYGIDHLGTPLCVVLGHSYCGAVTAVLTGAQLHGCIPALMAPIVPAVERAKREHPGMNADQLVKYAVQFNVWQSIEDLLSHSSSIRQRARDGALKIVGAVYDLDSGYVDWLGAHPEEALLLKA